MNEAFINFLIAFAIMIMGIIAGVSAYNECLLEEIEQYNSIRLNGIYYYPEEVINNES